MKSQLFSYCGAPCAGEEEINYESNHHIIESVHPSPLSARRGFFGSKPYSKINTILANMGEREIDWEIPNL